MAYKNVIPLFGLLAMAMVLASAKAETLYVSPTGNDTNPGTADKPILTLPHAIELVQAKVGKMTEDLTVNLLPGVYRLTAPLNLDAQDSGTADHDLIFTGDSSGQVIISGGVRVTGWTKVSGSKDLWMAPAPANLQNTRQLYVDGIRADRARGRLPVKLTENLTGYTADSDLMSHWKNPSDIEFVYTGGNALWSEPSVGLGAWTEPRCLVASISANQIVMAQPCWDNSTKRADLPPQFNSKRPANLVGPAHVGKQPLYVENAFELLGNPGQWYLDRAEKKIYYTPRPGEDLATADVEVPVLEKLIDAHGSPEHPLSHLVFANLQFSYATWLFPSTGEGFSEIQANYTITGKDGYATQGLGDFVPGGKQPYGDWTKTPGNISFNFANNIRFENDIFAHLGAAGLELGNGSQNDLVQGCIFTDISANGLELGGVNLPQATGAERTTDNKILSNHFYNVPAEFHGGVGIDVGYTKNTLIQNNQLDHLPYTAISLGWGGWPDKEKKPGIANNSEHAVIANNLIFDHLQLLADGGGIYTQGLTGPDLASGEQVIGNVIHDQFSSGHAIYSDNGSANMTITGNVIYHCNFDNWGSAHANYYNGNDGKTRDWFSITDNYWQQGTPDSDEKNVRVANNHLIADVNEVPGNTVQLAGLQGKYKDLPKREVEKVVPPAAPSRVSVRAVDSAAFVAWCPPTFSGGSTVVSYTVVSSAGDSTEISAADFRKFAFVKIPGLTNGKTYTFTVTAGNKIGKGTASMPSLPVTPSAEVAQVPGPPVLGAVYSADGDASIHFSAPADDGGSPITSYLFTAQPGDHKFELTGRIPITLSGRHSSFAVINGLQNGKTYTIEIAAVNAVGVGAPAKGKTITVGENPGEGNP